MQLVFTKPVGRWPAGHISDWPVQTWKDIERSLGLPLRDFTKPVDEFVKEHCRPPEDVFAEGITRALPEVSQRPEETDERATSVKSEPLAQKRRGRKPGKARAKRALRKESMNITKEGQGHDQAD